MFSQRSARSTATIASSSTLPSAVRGPPAPAYGRAHTSPHPPLPAAPPAAPPFPFGPTCYTSCASCPTTPNHDPYEGVAKAQRTERKNQNRKEASASSNLEEMWGRHAAAEATNRREDPRRLRAFRVLTTQALDVFCGDCAGIIGP